MVILAVHRLSYEMHLIIARFHPPRYAPASHRRIVYVDDMFIQSDNLKYGANALIVIKDTFVVCCYRAGDIQSAT